MFSSNKEYVNILSSKAETKAITRTNTEKGVQPHFIQKEIIKKLEKNRRRKQNKFNSKLKCSVNEQNLLEQTKKDKKETNNYNRDEGYKKKGMNTNTTIRNNM